MFERQSALAATLEKGGRDGADGQRRLRIGETRGWNLVQIAAFAARKMELDRALRSVLDTDLPPRVGTVINVARRRLLKTGAEQYWMFMPDGDELDRTLQAALAPHIGAVTPLSHSRTAIFVDGVAAREVLATGIAIDLDRNVLGVGKFVLTGVHHSPILLHRVGENRYELYAMRTFAVSVWDWLIDAALQYGYDVLTSSHA